MPTKAILEQENARLRRRIAKLEKQQTQVGQSAPLVETNERFYNLFQTMSQGVVYQDAVGAIILANPAAERILGLSLEQMQGRTSVDPRWRAVRADGSDFPGQAHPAMVALQTGKPVNDVVMGVYHPAQDETRWIQVSAQPEFRAGETQPYRVFASFTDITERQRAEDNLRHSERELQSFLNSSPDTIYILDVATNRSHFLNRDEFLGYSKSELEAVGSISAAIHPQDRKPLAKAWRAMTRSTEKHPISLEYRVQSKAGEWEWIRQRSSVLERAADGLATKILFTLSIITEQKRAEKALQVSNEKFNAVFYNAPLQGVIYRLIRDSQDRVVDWEFTDINPLGAASVGQTQNDLIGKRACALFGAAVIEPYLEICRQVIATGQPRQFETFFESNGRHYLTSVFMVGTEHYANFAVDITDRKRAEQEVQNLALFPQENPNPVLRINHAGEILYANPASRRLLQNWNCQIGDRVPEFWQQEITEVTTQQKNKVLDFSCDGIVYAATISYVASSQYVNLYLTNITERISAEESLRLQSAALNAAANEVLITDINGAIEWVNPAWCATTGFSFEQAIGKNPRISKSGKHPQAFYKNMWQQILSGKTWQSEMLNKRSDGTLYYEDVTIAPVRDNQGRITHFVGIKQDISERKRAEQDLRISQDKYRRLAEELELRVQERTAQVQDLYDTAPVGYHSLDAEGNFNAINQTELDWLGYTRAELLGKSFSIIIAPSTIGTAQEQFQQFKLSGSLRDLELDAVRKDGTTFPVLINATAIYDDKGQYLSSRSTLVDITARKRAEEALRANEERMKLAFQATQDGIWDWNMETNEVFYSSRYKTMLGYTDDQVEPHFSAWQRLIHPDDLPRAMQVVDDVLNKHSDYVVEFRMRHKDGHYVDILSRGFPIRRETDGAIIRIVGTHFDLTELKKAEQARYESEMRYRLIFENSLTGIIFSDPHTGAVLGANPAACQMWGGSEAEMRRAGRTQVIDPDDPRVEAALAERARTGRFSGELNFKHKDGTSFPIELNSTIFTTPNGELLANISFTDITLRKQAEETLHRANIEMERALRIKDEFLASMSHELRTPLNAILGLTQSMQEELLGPLNARQINSLQIIESSGRHLLSLINDILDLSKLEAGQMTLDRTPVSVNMICEASLVFIKQVAHKKRIRVSSQLDTTAEWVEADARRLKQMLVNLLSNAVKFTPENGQIALSVDADAAGETIQFSVRDTGIGIAPENLTRLFKPFVQLDSGLTRQFEGTGLGLSLVARMAELHGGSVSVESELGKGSCFSFRLPWTQEMQTYSLKPTGAPDARTRTAIATPGLPVNENAPLILIAEDNEPTISMMSVYLDAHGYRLMVARDGQTALDMARAHHPALILMDLQMPVLNGLEAIQRMRAGAPPLNTIPIIAVTAFAMPGDREHSLAAGANAYFSKPVDLKMLNELIAQLLKK